MKDSMTQKFLFIFIAFTLLVFSTPDLFAKVDAAAIQYKTTDNVNLRKGPSTKHNKILTIPKGKLVNYITKSGSWYKVNYNGKIGFVSSTYVKKTTVSKPAIPSATVSSTTIYQTTASLNLRSGASNKHKVVMTIPKGKNVTYLSKSGSWFKVKYSNKTGFVSSSYLKKPTTTVTPAVTYQTTANVNLRTGASNKHKVVVTIPKGKNVTYLSKSGTWYKVKYGNKTGFVSSSYLKKPTTTVTPTVTYQTTANVNLRTGASSKHKLVVTIPKGKNVTYLSKSGSWYKVKYGNKTGFISSSYLKKPTTTVTPTVTYQTTANVNLRTGASSKHKLVTTIPKGKNVTYLSKSGSWYKVKYGNNTGFVSSSYLKKPTTNAKISNYKLVRYYDTNVHVYTSNLNTHLTVSKGKSNVLETLSSLKVPNELAKANMGFFDSKMEHGGLYMVNGQVTSNHKSKYIIMEYKKTGKIDIRSLDKTNSTLGKNTLQELEIMKKNDYFAVGSSYSLVQNGKKNLAHSEYFAHSKSRNPRTLFGQTKDGRFIMAVTDGRIKGSSGLTASQSADVMLKLGAVEAVNFDGGGSSTFYIEGTLVNKLGESARRIGSALFITK